MLGVFKYYNFFIDSAMTILRMMGFEAHPSFLRLALPIGISFYTFQIIGYVVDVYCGRIPPCRNALAYFVSVSFFPKLATGPIEKGENIIPQFERARRFEYAMAVDGCRQMLWGLFMKIVIADQCGSLADRVFIGYESFSGSMRLLGAFLYTMQIYGDFSGYSDIAIGCAKLFGIRLSRNFAFPYFSRNVSEFWRRWHMTLMEWFKDYLYIPLGGSRCGKVKQLRNVAIVFLVSGLWHGANWTFVVWGAIHACLFIPVLLIKWSQFPLRLPYWLSVGLTFIVVMLAWVFFRSPDIHFATSYLSGIFSRSLFDLPHQYLSMLPWIATMLSIEWLQRKKEHAFDVCRLPKIARWASYLLLVGICVAYHQREAEFIYFQF